MTCIVGLTHRTGVLIGGDSAGSSGYSTTIRSDTKVFRNGPFVMGFTSSFRMGQLLRYRLAPPIPTDWDLDRFMATEFVDAVRECLDEHGWMGKDEGRDDGGTFLVGYEHSLYAVDSDFQIGRSEVGYDAVGCGADLAKGALFALGAIGTPIGRAGCALRAAAHHSTDVAGPFVFEDTSTSEGAE